MSKFLEENVEKKATSLMTDSEGGTFYRKIAKEYDRHSVDHHKGEYVRDDIHINTIETFFSHLKRSMKGTFKAISKQHLQSYLDAFVFHYNNRHNDRARFGVLLGTLLRA